MKIERRSLYILLSGLLALLCISLLLALWLDRTPAMLRVENSVPFVGKKMELQSAMDKIMEHFADNNLAAAENLLLEVVKQYPSNSDLWMLLGTVYYRQDKFKDAEMSFRHLLRQQPHNAAGFNNLSETLIKLQRLEEAQTAILQAVKLTPNNAEILLNAASLHAKLQDDKTALFYLKQAMNRGVTAETVSDYIDLVRLLERPDFMNYYNQQQQERTRRQQL